MKPITIERMEFIESINRLISESKLPLIVIEPILKDLYFQINELNRQQYKEDLKKYNELLARSAKESECIAED